jgi:UDP-GlcNAc:undecaprenyl-phosphate/decaprenyl-phosphate GlcNAc-1-phosphate transferase
MLKSILIIMALSICMCKAQTNSENTPVLKSQADRLSYGIGVQTARSFQQQGIEVEIEPLIHGILDTLDGKKLLLSEDELAKVMNDLSTDVRRRQVKNRMLSAADNAKAGAEFLERNKTNAGVVVLPNGLQYTVLKQGTGPVPAETNTFVCHYRGTFIDGTEFDNTYRRGQPEPFSFHGMIVGWREALKLMPVGSKWKIFVPHLLAFGQRGRPPRIAPNSTLIYELELVEIK